MLNSEKTRFYNAVFISAMYLFICWFLFLSDEWLGTELKNWGLRPRSLRGLVGIFSVHFLHANLDHIVNNTWAFLVLNTYFFFFYRSVAYKAFPIMLIGSAMLLWAWGRPANHIGASVMIYGLATFLFFSGLFRRSLPLMAVSALVLFSYGSMLWGILPIKPEMSWEGHLSGAVCGILLAYYFKEEGPQRKKYQWEIEEELEAERLAAEKLLQTEENAGNPVNFSNDQVQIQYDFKPRQAQEKPRSEDSSPSETKSES